MLAGHSQHKYFLLMLLMVTTSPLAYGWKPWWAAILPGKVKVKSSSTVSIFNFERFFPSLALSCFLPRYCHSMLKDLGNPGRHSAITGTRRVQICWLTAWAVLKHLPYPGEQRWNSACAHSAKPGAKRHFHGMNYKWLFRENKTKQKNEKRI